MSKEQKSRARGEAVKPAETDVAPAKPAANQHMVAAVPGRSDAQVLADSALAPMTRNAALASGLSTGLFGSGAPAIAESTAYVQERCDAVRAGDLDGLTDTLAAHVVALDALFTETLRRSLNNLGAHPAAADRYMAMALKAQANCRITAETVARIKRDGRQVVKVVHVHEGGQAVVADTINQGAREGLPRG